MKAISLKLDNETKKKIIPYILISPTILWYLVFWARPVFTAIIRSFYDINGKFTFSNYTFIFHDPNFPLALANTFIIVLFSVFLEFIAAFALAMLINRKFKGSSILLFIATIPMALPFVAVAAMWKAGLTTYGWLNSFLYYLGVIGKDSKIIFMTGDRVQSLILIILVDAWGVIPSIMVILLAGMQNMNKEYQEAAYIFGADKWTTLKKITFPLLKPTITTALILRIISALQIWAIITLMFGFLRLPTIVSQLVYYNDQRGPADPEYYQRSLAYSVIASLIISLVVVIYLKIANRKKEEKNEH